METIWAYWNSFKHNWLYNNSFKYRQALRLIDIQEAKIADLTDSAAGSRKALAIAAKNLTNDTRVINKLMNDIVNLEKELESIKSVSPFKGPQQFLADAIKEGETN